MTQQERDDPGLTEMVLDAEPEEEAPKVKAGNSDEQRRPPNGEAELPLAGQ